MEAWVSGVMIYYGHLMITYHISLKFYIIYKNICQDLENVSQPLAQ